jgi:hypothetical protein
MTPPVLTGATIAYGKQIPPLPFALVICGACWLLYWRLIAGGSVRNEHRSGQNPPKVDVDSPEERLRQRVSNLAENLPVAELAQSGRSIPQKKPRYGLVLLGIYFFSKKSNIDRKQYYVEENCGLIAILLIQLSSKMSNDYLETDFLSYFNIVCQLVSRFSP